VRVFIGSRDLSRGAQAAETLATQGLQATAIRLDLDQPQTLSEAAEIIAADHGRLDILVNNAGIFDLADTPPSQASLEAVRRTMEVNFIGPLAVTQAMLPLLRLSPAASIVNVSSALGSLSLNADPGSTYHSQQFIGYNASKAALNMLTIQLHEELRDTAIKVNAISPGFVRTDLTGGYGDMSPEEGARLPAQYALNPECSGGFIEPAGKAPW